MPRMSVRRLAPVLSLTAFAALFSMLTTAAQAGPAPDPATMEHGVYAQPL